MPIVTPNQMNSVHHFSSLLPNNLVHSDKYLWLQSSRMEDNADISMGSKITNFEVPNSAIG